MTLEPNTTASTPRKLALIVGVNEAKESEQAALRFAQASAVRLAEALAAPACGFSIHNEAPLLGPAATAANVRRTTLKLLRTLTAPDDLLVIVFIGHGIPLPGDERDDVLLATADLDIVAAEADSSDWLGLQGAAADPKDGVVTAESLASHVAKSSVEQIVCFGPETGTLPLAYAPAWIRRSAAPRQPWVNVPPRPMPALSGLPNQTSRSYHIAKPSGL